MKKLIVLFLLIATGLAAQQNAGTGPKENSVKRDMQLRKQQRREARAKRKAEKAERKAVKKHHKRIQTKKVRKRMKESRKTAVRNNDNRREFFIKRWFRRKKGR
jgi:hypothetical protein